MEMLLMGACLSMFGLAVCLSGLRRGDARSGDAAAAAPAVEKETVKAAAVARALLCRPAGPPHGGAHAASRSKRCCSQIENHVRLEQAAAECFLESPNPSLLHSRTISTLVN